MFKYFYNFIDKVKSKLTQKGQGMVEYALIIAFVAGIALVALNTNLGSAIQGAFSSATEAINGAKGTGSGTNTNAGSSTQSETSETTD